LNTFTPHNIPEFTDEHLRASGVDVRTEQRVSAVEPGVLKCLDKTTKQTHDVPFGLCVWSTGVGPRQVTS
jgi:NADH dehydrogenase FAD-containing subunit